MSAAELEAAKDEIAKLRAEVERLKSGEPPADLWMRSGGKRVRAAPISPPCRALSRPLLLPKFQLSAR